MNLAKRAYIADSDAGSYRRLVEAAEACQVSIIHPGKPCDRSAPDPAELMRRAEPLQWRCDGGAARMIAATYSAPAGHSPEVPMPDTLTLWHADHVNFAKLLDLLENRLGLLYEGGTPEYELILDIMYYLTHYADVLHHPKEDLVFAKIKERDGSAAAKIDELLEHHVSLKACGEQLYHDLVDIINGSIVSRGHIEASARAYLTKFRDHMRVEEAEMLPLAARLLSHKDWTAIDTAIRYIEDPLFGARTDERYAAIAQQIARQTKGADARTR